jgi:hypothetical protein
MPGAVLGRCGNLKWRKTVRPLLRVYAEEHGGSCTQGVTVLSLRFRRTLRHSGGGPLTYRHPSVAAMRGQYPRVPGYGVIETLPTLMCPTPSESCSFQLRQFWVVDPVTLLPSHSMPATWPLRV